MRPWVAHRLPLFTSLGAVVIVALVQILEPTLLRRLEAGTYDWRVRLSRSCPAPCATNLGFVFMSDDTIARVSDGSLGYAHGLYWPRHIYGRVTDELTAEGARAIAFDVLLPQARRDHPPVLVPAPLATEAEKFLAEIHPDEKPIFVEGSVSVESDDYFAWQLRRSGRVLLAAERRVEPLPLLRTNATGLGDVSADLDLDGVLRRARPFKVYREWHQLFLLAQTEFGVDLEKAVIKPGSITLPRVGEQPVVVELDAHGQFAPADFVGEAQAHRFPARAKPFMDRRVWHMGLALAAAELGLNLDQAEMEPHQIVLTGPGVQRIVPLDSDGCIPIEWSLDIRSPMLRKEALESTLESHRDRIPGQAPPTNHWQGFLVLVGSSATGNDLSDRGATPLSEATLLVSQHWNLANSVLTGRFVRHTPAAIDFTIICLMGALTSWLTWRLRALAAAFAVLLVAAMYVALAAWLYVQWRWWLPMALPVLGAGFFQHVCLVTYRVVFEEREKRKVRSVFSKVVSPNVVQELLASKKVAFGGAQREITVLFADVRGFTQLTDRNRAEAETHIRTHQLNPADAAAYLDQQARETLLTVNLYLATVADVVKRHAGTLDKYIGDCVMAFWGAPTPNPRHAVSAVEAAVEAQRAIHALNIQREVENQGRTAAGLPPLALLNLGSGLNTGVAIVGLMGSDQHVLNYTVFGREVNLASRLEGVSGRGRVIVGETTYQHLLRDAPALANRCRPLAPTTVKGIAETLTCYEVPWQEEPQQSSSADRIDRRR